MHFAGTACVLTAAPPITLSGVLGASGTTATITGASQTITGAGTIKFVNVDESLGNLEYSYNGGAFTGLAEGTTLVVANGSSLQMHATAMAVTDVVSCSVRNNANNALIANVDFERTS